MSLILKSICKNNFKIIGTEKIINKSANILHFNSSVHQKASKQLNHSQSLEENYFQTE